MEEERGSLVVFGEVEFVESHSYVYGGHYESGTREAIAK